jgi:hypothetical protein
MANHKHGSRQKITPARRETEAKMSPGKTKNPGRKSEFEREKIRAVEICLLARIKVTAVSNPDAQTLAAGIFGSGKRIVATTQDGIPFTLRVF